MLFSFVKEQTEENVNMLFVTNATRNIQKTRPRGGVLSEDELMQTCHHELCNLQLCADVWWCTKDYLGGPQWSERAIGCAFCERMFTVGDK